MEFDLAPEMLVSAADVGCGALASLRTLLTILRSLKVSKRSDWTEAPTDRKWPFSASMLLKMDLVCSILKSVDITPQGYCCQ